MWFVDHATISVKAGDGGRGCQAFAQPPYTRYPRPDGGDGGDGGHVIVRADPQLATLLDFQFHHTFHAGRGGHGSGNGKTGKRGDDRLIRVPVGTVISDADAGMILHPVPQEAPCVTTGKHGPRAQSGLPEAPGPLRRAGAGTALKPWYGVHDLAQAGDEVLVAKGGRGGLGNASASDATPGTLGEQRRLHLELKLIADVGLVGLPNAGKSSLLARISTARPKIAAYPFTTRYPVLGVARLDEVRAFVACDIPGLLEGAHEGKGLGMQFLRHIERTKLLVHLIDMAAVDGRDPTQAYRQLNHELAAYSAALPSKPQLIVANKMDVPEAHGNLETFERAVRKPVWPISCATGVGIPALIQAIWQALSSVRPVGSVEPV